MKCKRNIPCPMGGMMCCLDCKDKACKENCGKQIYCLIEAWMPSIKNGIILLTVILLVMALYRIGCLEKEHNTIIDRIDQVENNITKYIDEKLPSEEFTDTEENLGGEFKSWMSFQTTIG